MTVDVARLQGLHDRIAMGAEWHLSGESGPTTVYSILHDEYDQPYQEQVADCDRGDGELIVAAVNALPDLLAVVAERDKLAATVARVELAYFTLIADWGAQIKASASTLPAPGQEALTDLAEKHARAIYAALEDES